jgi:hypothetical protein
VAGSSQGEGVALGFRVKTGRAVAIVLAGPVNAPKVVARHELVLADKAVPDSFYPYHAGLELSPKRAATTVRQLSDIVRKVSVAAVELLVEELRQAGSGPRAAGIVVGSVVDPSTIKNPHMHAHAAEGRLFLEAVAAGLERCELPSTVHAEKELYENAAKALRATEGTLDRAVVAMGKAFGKPWRLEEKTAALAAWVALGGR